jgi:hypothetical protein
MAVHKRKTSKRKVSKRKYQNAAGSTSTGGTATGGSATGGSVSGIAVGGDKSEQNIATGGSTIKKGNKKSSRGGGSSRGRGSSSSPSLMDRIKKKGNEFLDFIGFEDGGTSAFSNPMDQHGHGVQRGGKKSKR